IDYYWEKLGAGGKYDRCGWLVDKFGLSWQIVPAMLGKWMSDPEKAPKVTAAFMQMTKFDIKTLEEA
ncbi:MAG: VOC family protein, partial [Chitinophagaceae bacterium]